MGVRSDVLWSALVPRSSANFTVYTCDPGIRTIIKHLSINIVGTTNVAELLFTSAHGLHGSSLWRVASTGSAFLAILSPAFIVLEAGDSVGWAWNSGTVDVTCNGFGAKLVL